VTANYSTTALRCKDSFIHNLVSCGTNNATCRHNFSNSMVSSMVSADTGSHHSNQF
jgi:hypothetical protein